MSLFLLVLFALQSTWLVIWGLLRKGRIVEVPFLAGCTLAGFALPQFIGLLNDPTLPDGGLERTLAMANLCTAGLYLGYTRTRLPMRMLNWHYDGMALRHGATGLTLFGAAFFFLISRLPEELTNQSQWTGLPVIYLYFAQVMAYGFALIVLFWGGYRSRYALAIGAIAAFFYLDRILIAARRGVASEFVLILLAGIWFTRRWCPPRWAMITFAVLAVLFVNSAKDIRNATMGGASFGSILQGRENVSAQELAKINYVENVANLTAEGGQELRTAVFDIAAYDRTEAFDYGLNLWNRFINRNVPGQLTGERTKQALMADLPDVTFMAYGFLSGKGTTHTGFSDAFGSFWYFGCVVFFIIGHVMARLFRAGMEGHLLASLLYMIMATNALHAITHGTYWFFSPWPHIFIFIFPVLLLSRVRLTPYPIAEQPNSGRQLESLSQT